jgi:hypothetical protein
MTSAAAAVEKARIPMAASVVLMRVPPFRGCTVSDDARRVK